MKRPSLAQSRPHGDFLSCPSIGVLMRRPIAPSTLVKGVSGKSIAIAVSFSLVLLLHHQSRRNFSENSLAPKGFTLVTQKIHIELIV